MNMAVVGAARVVFGADTSDFDAGAAGIEGVLGRLVEKFEAVERKLKAVGTGLTLGITVPFAAMVRTIDKGAGSFEAQMNKVRAALMDASPDEINALAAAARKMGPAVGVGATEAAGAIDSLARAGVAAADILGGALDATLKLSAAGMTDAESSAALVTDVMGQFGKTASDLPAVMTNIVGALDASKMGFDDFRLAVGQGGAIAAASGVSFEDFSTAIAATSTMFASGADAGTSFKTYIQTLTGKSKEAQAALTKLGISFYDQSGALKPLNEQAQILQDALGNLTDKSKQDALTPIFGADAARTAIGLMNQGREGFEKFRDAVANGDVDGKIAVTMQGSEAAGKRIAAAWEGVKIALGVDTGLLKITTAIKNAFASMLEAIANASPWVLKVGAAFAALGAAIGPLMVVVAHLGAMFLATFVSKFGLIGRVVGLIISPISTLVGLLGEMGLARVLAMVTGRFLAFMGPVGLALSAILMFKDEIAFALSAVWKSFTETLGPPMEALFGKITGLFAKLSGGPIGSAIDGLISLLSGLKDVVGTVLVGAIMLAGEIIERVLAGVIAVFSGVVDVISGVVDVISALLSGDFSGAWEAAGRVVEAMYDTIINVISALVPEISAPLQQAWAAAKKWLADGFHAIVGWFTASVQSGVNFVANAFPNVVAAAKGVYQGVKAWLVDKFGGLMTWIGNAAKWIGDKYSALKERLGLGGSANDNTPAAPAKPAEAKDPAAPKKTVNFDDDPASKKQKAGAKGRNTGYDAGNRQQLQDDLELEAARLRGDVEAERAIRTRLELSKQIEAYQRTGLSLEAATTAAKRDMATLEAARREGMAKDLERDEAAHQIDLARIVDNRALEETLQRQRDLKDAIAGFQRDGLSLEEATARALRQQLDIDQARAEMRARILADEEQDRQVSLAKARGDSEERIRQLQREIDIRNRQRELEQDMDATAAKDQATREWDEMEKARQTGVFRDTFKGGVRAALDGDLGGWLKNWWRDRVAKGMEEALNSLADLISNLFSNIGKSSGGGGILGSIGKVVGGLVGGGSGGGFDKSAAVGVDWNDLPGFKTGGSFTVGGNPGIDRNVVSFKASAGEVVDIQKPGNDNGGSGGVIVHQEITFSGAMDLATKEEAIRFADAGRQAAINAINEANRRRG